MKAKTIRIKTINDGLKDFVQAFKAAQSGKSAKQKSGIFFSSVEAVRKILTTERIKLLQYIKVQRPDSIYALAKGMGKNIKNISQDLGFLAAVGLVELMDTNGPRNQRRPVLLSDHITLELVI